MLKPEASQFLQALRSHYPVRTVPPSETPAGVGLYLVDLAEWRLRFSDQTPLIWVPSQTASPAAAGELAGRLTDLARQHRWRDRDCLVLLDAPEAELKERLAHQDYPRLVVLDASDQEGIVSASGFTNALQDLLTLRLPLSHLAPYQISGTVQGSCFFGRQQEITRILGHEKASFAILGIRRVGKTWLLGQIRNRLLDRGEEPSRLLLIDCTTLTTSDSFISTIVHKLDVKEYLRLKKHGTTHGFDLTHFLKLMSKRYAGQITLFLDEFDKIVQLSRENPDLLSTIRALANTGYCRFLVAGFQELMSEIGDPSSALFFGFEIIRLQAFKVADTREMVISPMQSLRVRVEHPDGVVARIHADTRGMPLFIQHCCIELMKKLESRGDRTVREADLDEIYESDEFKTLIVNSFRDNVSPRDQLLVYALLVSFEDKASYTREEMTQALRQQHCPATVAGVDQSCDRLVLGGILQREGKNFHFAIPIFPQTMRIHFNMKYLLTETRRELGL